MDEGGGAVHTPTGSEPMRLFMDPPSPGAGPDFRPPASQFFCADVRGAAAELLAVLCSLLDVCSLQLIEAAVSTDRMWEGLEVVQCLVSGLQLDDLHVSQVSAIYSLETIHVLILLYICGLVILGGMRCAANVKSGEPCA